MGHSPPALSPVPHALYSCFTPLWQVFVATNLPLKQSQTFKLDPGVTPGEGSPVVIALGDLARKQCTSGGKHNETYANFARDYATSL